jgi:hypothetical protein
MLGRPVKSRRGLECLKWEEKGEEEEEQMAGGFDNTSAASAGRQDTPTPMSSLLPKQCKQPRLHMHVCKARTSYKRIFIQNSHALSSVYSADNPRVGRWGLLCRLHRSAAKKSLGLYV